MRSASRVPGIVATAVSAAGVVLAIVVLLDHGAHPPHEDADLFLGLIGLIAALAALGGSIALLLSAGVRRPERPRRRGSSAPDRPRWER